MFGVADYYFMKAGTIKIGINNWPGRILEKSIELYTALENMAAIYLKSTYSDRKKKALEVISNY